VRHCHADIGREIFKIVSNARAGVSFTPNRISRYPKDNDYLGSISANICGIWRWRGIRLPLRNVRVRTNVLYEPIIMNITGLLCTPTAIYVGIEIVRFNGQLRNIRRNIRIHRLSIVRLYVYVSHTFVVVTLLDVFY